VAAGGAVAAGVGAGAGDGDDVVPAPEVHPHNTVDAATEAITPVVRLR
jgi:hypothetical protein